MEYGFLIIYNSNIFEGGKEEMIDLEDLNKLRICSKCNCVYMPKFEKQLYYDDFEINNEFCERCVPLEKKEEQEK